MSGDDLVQMFVDLVRAPIPHVPPPGHQADWAKPEPGDDVETAAGLAVRRLLDLGATTEDLYAVSRGITLMVGIDALATIDEHGDSSSELYSAIAGQ